MRLSAWHSRALQQKRRAYGRIRLHYRPPSGRGGAGKTNGALIMRVTHSLVGYDRHTDRMKCRLDVPDNLMPEVKRIIRVPTDDPDAVWSYPLTQAKVRLLASLIGAEIDLADAD